MRALAGVLWCAVWLSACGGQVAEEAMIIAHGSGGLGSPGAPADGMAAGGSSATGGTAAIDAGETGGIGDAGVDAPDLEANLPPCPEIHTFEPCRADGACASTYTNGWNCVEQAECGTGGWRRTTSCVSFPPCPNERPIAGSPCPEVGLECRYNLYSDSCLACDGECQPTGALVCEDGYCCDEVSCDGVWHCDAEGLWQTEWGWRCIG
jgi:hypothetical protein